MVLSRLSVSKSMTLLSTLMVVGVLLVSCVALIDAYFELVGQTRRVSTNLALTVEHSISEDFDLFDLSLQGIIRALGTPGLENVSPELRNAILFDPLVDNRRFATFLVVNAEGAPTAISGSRALPERNFADRRYFQEHQRSASLAPFVGPVFVGKLSGERSISISRRLPSVGGRFEGLVVGIIHLSLFQQAFNRLDLGRRGSITLVAEDGTLVSRYPELSSMQVTEETRKVYEEAARKDSGFGTAVGPDGEFRYYAYRRVAKLPLFVVVGLSVRDVLAPWTRKVAIIGSLTLVLCGAIVVLTRVLSRELVRRRAAEAGLMEFNHQLEARVRTEVAAREEAQTRLVAGQRMEALGQLAGGVAHDLNNVLQAVSSANRLLGQPMRREDDQERLIGMIAEATDRGASVTRRLLAFARQSELKTELVDVVALVTGLKQFLAHTLGGGIKVNVESDAEMAPALIDRAQLETVLVNLATNARDAMTLSGGLLTIRISRQEVHTSPRLSGLNAGSYLCLAITDTGCGMSTAVQERAVEPFFTTKPVGTGTGLGLAMANGFAEQSGGLLTIVSQVGVGTTVLLWLPHADGMPIQSEPSSIERVSAAGQPACILLVDDDVIVRELLAEELEEQGYQVMQAANGFTGLELVNTMLDVLVTDLSMPGMDGLTLIKEAQRRRPSLPAILVTGYAGDSTSLARSGVASGSYSLLHKPLRASQLTDRIASLLNQNRAERTAHG